MYFKDVKERRLLRKEDYIMTGKLIGALIAIVIGLALLPVIADFVTDLTAEPDPIVEGGLASLVELLPIIYVIIIIGGVVGYLGFATRK